MHCKAPRYHLALDNTPGSPAVSRDRPAPAWPNPAPPGVPCNADSATGPGAPTERTGKGEEGG